MNVRSRARLDRQGDRAPRLENDRPCQDSTQLRARQIAEDCDIALALVSELPKVADAILMLVAGAVRKIDSCNIETPVEQFFQDSRPICCRP